MSEYLLFLFEAQTSRTEFNSYADRVDGDLNCIKGGGACHLREKVLAEAADTWVIVADYRKNSELLGTNVRHRLTTRCTPIHAMFSGSKVSQSKLLRSPMPRCCTTYGPSVLPTANSAWRR